MNRAQAGLQTRTVTINVEFSITLECSELEGDNLYWIGLHDMNKNGRHRWADCPAVFPKIDLYIYTRNNYPNVEQLKLSTGGRKAESLHLVKHRGIEVNPPEEVLHIVKQRLTNASGECVYLNNDGKWEGTDCSATQVNTNGLYAICERPPRLEDIETTHQPQETTTDSSGVWVQGSSTNQTKNTLDDDEGIFLTDEVLISLALIQLPAVMLSVLGIIRAFHKYGCSCQGLVHVLKASLLVFIPFFAIELIGSVFELIGLCLGLVPCSRMIRNLHRVSLDILQSKIFKNTGSLSCPQERSSPADGYRPSTSFLRECSPTNFSGKPGC